MQELTPEPDSIGGENKKKCLITGSNPVDIFLPKFKSSLILLTSL
jgi:hypothetical protein